MPHVEKTAVSLLAAMLVALALSGCGVRGSLEAPAEAKAAGTATSAEAADPGESSATTKTTGHKPFILDGLIR